MRPALAAIADDGDLLALDEVEIGITIVIDAHFSSFPFLNSEHDAEKCEAVFGRHHALSL